MMMEKLPGLLLKALLLVFALTIGVGIWYYALGRKPKIVLTAPLDGKSAMPFSYPIGAGEVLLVTGTKIRLYDIAAGKEKWTSDLAPTPAPAPAPAAAPAPKPAAAAAPPKPAIMDPAKNDPMRQIVAGRIARRSAKLAQSAAELNSKRAALDTPLKVENFKIEEAKYQAELKELEATRLSAGQPSGVAPAAAPNVPAAPAFAEHEMAAETHEIFRLGSTIWVVGGKTVRLLDHANGRLLKEIALPGRPQKVMQGNGCVYVTTQGDASGQQIARIAVADSAVTALPTAGSEDAAGSRYSSAAEIQSQRTAFSANASELLQIDVRLVERKVTERQALKNDSATDWANADKQSTGGGAEDAALMMQAVANDSQREQTGGKDLIDESTYEVQLRRPFQPTAPRASAIQVQGKPEAFSTASLDLIVAGQALIAFDHSNKKLWEAKLAYPLAAKSYGEYHTPENGTQARPILEDGKRLYIFDRGFLSAFDVASGATLWRLPSIGIRKILLDQPGSPDATLYVLSGNESAESLRYSQQAAEPTTPQIIKVETRSGKILWQVDKYQDCFVSGGQVYAALEARNPNDLVDSVFEGGAKGPPVRFKLYKLSARDGKPQWEWFQPRRPLQIEADGRKVSLLFRDELQVLSSRAL